MVVLDILLLILGVILLGGCHFLLHCPHCGRLFPQLTDEKKLNAANLRPKIITPTDIAWGCYAESYMEVCDVETIRTYRCTNPRCLYTWQQTEQITEEYKPRS